MGPAAASRDNRARNRRAMPPQSRHHPFTTCDDASIMSLISAPSTELRLPHAVKTVLPACGVDGRKNWRPSILSIKDFPVPPAALPNVPCIPGLRFNAKVSRPASCLQLKSFFCKTFPIGISTRGNANSVNNGAADSRSSSNTLQSTGSSRTTEPTLPKRNVPCVSGCITSTSLALRRSWRFGGVALWMKLSQAGAADLDRRKKTRLCHILSPVIGLIQLTWRWRPGKP